MSRKFRAIVALLFGSALVMPLAPAQANPSGVIVATGAFVCNINLVFPVAAATNAKSNCEGAAEGTGFFAKSGNQQTDVILPGTELADYALAKGLYNFRAYNIRYIEQGGVAVGRAHGHFALEFEAVSLNDPKGTKGGAGAINTYSAHGTFDYIRAGDPAIAIIPSQGLNDADLGMSVKGGNVPLHIHEGPLPPKTHKHKKPAKVSCGVTNPQGGAVMAFRPKVLPPPTTPQNITVEIAGVFVIVCA